VGKDGTPIIQTSGEENIAGKEKIKTIDLSSGEIEGLKNG
jgi:hypothetical protein